VGMLAFGLVGIGVHSAGWWRLEQDRLMPPKGRRGTRRHRLIALRR
jgi:hypothetical protein